MAIQDWATPEDFEAFAGGGEAGFIFKHSTRCPVSFEALREVEAFAKEQGDAPVFRVLVVENRPTSQRIAESLGVPHASPQAILVAGGGALWHASHWDVTAASLAEAWARAAAD